MLLDVNHMSALPDSTEERRRKDWIRKKRREARRLIKDGTSTCHLPRAVNWVPSGSPYNSGHLQIRRSLIKRTTLDHPDAPEPTTFISSHHVVLHPDERQRRILHSWMRTCRDFYNATRIAINELYDGPIYTRDHCPEIGDDEKQDLRNYMFEMKDEIWKESKADVGQAFCRRETMDLVFDRCVSDYLAARSNLLGRHIRSGRFTLASVETTDKYWLKIAGRIFREQGSIYPSALGRLEAYREVGGRRQPYDLSTITRDSTLVYRSATHLWDLYVPQNNAPSEAYAGPSRTVALDPGYRTLLTGYSDHHLLSIGDGIMELGRWYEQQQRRYERLGHKKAKQKLRAKLAQTRSRRKRKIYRKRLRRGHHRRAKLAALDRKLRDRIDDVHWKTIRYLTTNYGHILLGDMSPVRTISREGTLARSVKRRMVQIRYGTFVQRLRYKCQCKGVSLTVVDESWTSVTCGACGHTNDKNPSKTFRCAKCHYTIDRDVNGARNIYLKSRQ